LQRPLVHLLGLDKLALIIEEITQAKVCLCHTIVRD
jgi:hypothetical protein